MKRKFLVLAVLAVAAVALTTADASAWGWWRYRANNRPYNAFTPTCFGCGHGNHGGLRARGWHHHSAPTCNSCSCSCSCMAGPMQGSMMNAQYVDPSLLPYMAQAAPIQMQMQMPMPMPIQQATYQEPYGVSPVNYYMPAYYPAYQPYPYYYYPMQPTAPYSGGYGYGYGY